MLLENLGAGSALEDCTMAPMPAGGAGGALLAFDDGAAPRRPVRRAELDGTDIDSVEMSQVSE
eukprot:6279601-Prymnesium_polylepis.1